jgi:hypothetical protein
MTQGFEKDYRAEKQQNYFKRSVASTGLTVGEARLAFLIFTLLVPSSHAI